MPQLRLLIPPDPKEARAVRERVSAFVRALQIDDDALADIVTTIGEAFANAVQHAHTQDAIELTAWLDDDGRLCVRIVDRGRGFLPVPVTEVPTVAAEVMAECGRGMWIMNSCSDSFSIESLPDVGTAIVFSRQVRGVEEGAKPGRPRGARRCAARMPLPSRSPAPCAHPPRCARSRHR